MARVLVVDDLIPNVKLLAAKLSNEYYDVVTATSGEQALLKVQEEPPDVVLLDVMMPGMDGFEVCRRLKSGVETSHIPVVMVTALSDSENRVKGLDAGADDFLTKPVNDVALFARVRSLVRLKNTIDQWRLREATSGRLGVLRERAIAQAEVVEGARALLVNDDPHQAHRIAETIALDGIESETYAQTAPALEAAMTERFDLVMVSLALQHEDGLRLVSRLRAHERTRQIPILLMGDECDLSRAAKGLEVGANDYVLQPVDKGELRARCRSQVRQKRYQDRLLSNYEASIAMAHTDPLTGLYNRRYLNFHVEKQFERARETKKPLSVMIFDLDRFKLVNDQYGHPAGDAVLREFAQRVSANLRAVDTIARPGGEEFVAVLPDTALDVAQMVAERLRAAVADTLFALPEPDPAITVTTSIGLAVLDASDQTVDDLLRRADKAVYEAKHAGRNRVIVAGIGGQPGTPSTAVPEPASQAKTTGSQPVEAA